MDLVQQEFENKINSIVIDSSKSKNRIFIEKPLSIYNALR
jgi:hypothetical protein